MASRVLLNLDGGEHDHEPLELYELADVVHVACGGHAGDAASMDRVTRACVRAGTQIGAHPSYVDREGFGRRALEVSPEVLVTQVQAQCAALFDVAAHVPGAAVVSFKPHGALYHAAHTDEAVARACVEGARAALGPSVIVVGLAGGAFERIARELGHPFFRETFADRGVQADGSLIPRGEPGAVVDDPATARARAEELVLRGGSETLCVHADTPAAVRIARVVRAVLGERAPRPR